MSYSLHKSPSARQDMREIAYYLEEVAGLNTAERFYSSAEREFEKILTAPFAGAPWDTPGTRGFEMRTRQITGFRKYLIIYRVVGEVIEISRVLHSARDMDNILRDETDPTSSN